MEEHLVPLFLLILIICITGIIYVSCKFPLIGSIFRFLFKMLSIVFSIFLSILIITAYSFLACIVILFIILFVEETHFFYLGEPLNPILHPFEIMKLSITYGLLYFMVNSLCSLFYSWLRFNVWMTKILIFITTTLTMMISYPLLIRSLFPDLTTTITATFYLVGIISIFYLVNQIRREYYAFLRSSNLPWLKKRQPPKDHL